MIDLFAGIGGIRLGFERAFDDAQTVFVSEIDAHARATYAENFPADITIEGDITQIAAEDIPPFDICLAGFPCQAFSIAGKRGGFDDDYHGTCRGTLFLDVVRICDYHKPKIIFCENVKGLVNHDGGRTFKIICAAFEQIGYKIFHAVLNSRDFGLPQNRERIYIVCFRRDIAPEKFTFPAPNREVSTIADIIDAAPIPAKYYLSDVYLATLRRHRQRHEAAGNGFGYEIKSLDGVASALVCGGMGRERNLIVDARAHSKIPTTKIHGAINDENIRKLTPREWARLQGFPDDFRLSLSDTHLYRQFGNTVSINVVEAIAAEIRSVLEPMAYNKGEWSEFYVLLRLIADGAITNVIDGKIRRLPVMQARCAYKNHSALELRRLKNFVTLYRDGDRIKKISADDLAAMADTILDGIRRGKGHAFEIHGATDILDVLGLETIKSPSDRKSDIELTIRDAPTDSDKPVGYSIKSYVGGKPTLFNASGATNFRFRAVGVNSALAEKINAIDTRTKIIDRLSRIERLEFVAVKNSTFANNLRLIDSKMGRILGEMVKLFYVERISGCSELATRLEDVDPLKVGVKNFYRVNIKKFLRNVALGLRPAEVWNGRIEASGGCIVVKRNADIVLYPLQNHDDFETYLLNETRLETPDTRKHTFATVYPEVDWGGAQNSSSTSTCKSASSKKIPAVQSSDGIFYCVMCRLED
ncbi:MAG: HpaII family restriction endonuclease [Quinella sp. 1Q7]|nr:HpaII family restriction endonuclease [Quinella sp. 1Q7]